MQPVAPPEPSSLRLVATLGVAGLLAGVAIVGIYETTRDTIAANKAQELRAAVVKVVPGTATMKEVVLDAETTVYAGYSSDGRFAGWAVPAEGAGFQDTIRLLYGYDPRQKRIVGMWILESRETPGLGDKIFKDPVFVGAFTDLAVEPQVVLTKGGASANNEVDAITGATISSRAVVRIINETHDQWRPQLAAAPEE